MERYLFVCSAGKKRSPTAVHVAYDLARWKGKTIEAECGAIDIELRGSRRELARHFEKYDKVFIMEERMRKKLVLRCGIPSCKITSLDIPDNYEQGQKELVDLLSEKLMPYMC